MTDEVVTAEPIEQPAPELEATAAPVTDVETPVEQPKEETKTFTQEELDKAIGKRLARERRAWEREQPQRMAEPPKAPVAPEQFETTEAYAEALAEQKAQELLQKREQERYQSEVFERFATKEEEAIEKYGDYDQVVKNNPSLPITQVMADVIRMSDLGPDIAYYLGMNPKDAARISQLPAGLQAKEIGKIEAKLESNPPAVKKTTSAPAPIAPVNARSTGTPAYDTTDPRSIKTMSTSEWIEAERRRQIKQWEARTR